MKERTNLQKKTQGETKKPMKIHKRPQQDMMEEGEEGKAKRKGRMEGSRVDKCNTRAGRNEGKQ